MEQYKRNHFIVVFDNIVSIFIKSFLPMLILIFAKSSKNEDKMEEIWTKLGVFAFIICLIFIYSIVQWWKKKYCIIDNMIIITQGVFVTKHREIPFNKIQTVNISENMKQRIFEVACLKIDTENSSSDEAEVNIVIKKREAEILKNEILKLKDGNSDMQQENVEKIVEQGTDEIKANNKDLFIASLTENSWFAGIAAIFVAYQFMDDYLGDLVKKKFDSAASYAKTVDFNSIPVKKLVVLISGIIIIYLIFSIGISMIKTFIKFHDFSLKREGKNIVINYGLFEKKNYTMLVNKISAVYIKRNLFRQWVGLSEIHIESVGYGNEKGESSMLFPIVNVKKQEYIIKNILPEFYFEGQFTKSPKRSLKRFINHNLMIIAVPCIVLSFKFKYGPLSLLLIPIFIFSGYKEYKNSGIYINDQLLCLSCNGFDNEVSIVLLKRVQSTEISQNCFQRRAAVLNFEISIQGNSFGKEIKVENLSEESVERFE